LSLLILATLVSAAGGASAWGNGGYSANQSNPDYGTHDGIAELALTITTKNVSFLKTNYRTQFLLGTEAPDNPDFVGDTTLHHVYYYSTGTLQDDKSAARARTVYSQALADLKASDLSGAAFLIGEMSHYVADVGVFSHTMADSTDWGAEVHHSDYEKWFDGMIKDHVVPNGYVSNPKGAYEATLLLANSITFGDGAAKPNVWMDANYNWADTAGFVPSALRSLDLSIQAVASVIDNLVAEAAYNPPANPDPPSDPVQPPDSTIPPEDIPEARDSSLSNAIIVTLTTVAVLAVSGILLVAVRKKK